MFINDTFITDHDSLDNNNNNNNLFIKFVRFQITSFEFSFTKEIHTDLEFITKSSMDMVKR